MSDDLATIPIDELIPKLHERARVLGDMGNLIDCLVINTLANRMQRQHDDTLLLEAENERLSKFPDWEEFSDTEGELADNYRKLKTEVERLDEKAKEQGRNACEMFDHLKAEQKKSRELEAEIERLRDQVKHEIREHYTTCESEGLSTDGFPEWCREEQTNE